MVVGDQDGASSALLDPQFDDRSAAGRRADVERAAGEQRALAHPRRARCRRRPDAPAKPRAVVAHARDDARRRRGAARPRRSRRRRGGRRSTGSPARRGRRRSAARARARRAPRPRGRASVGTPVWRSKSPTFERSAATSPWSSSAAGRSSRASRSSSSIACVAALLRLAQLVAQLVGRAAAPSPRGAAARRSAPGWPRRGGRARCARARPPARASRRARPARARPRGGRACGRRRGAGARPRASRRSAARAVPPGAGSRRTPSRAIRRSSGSKRRRRTRPLTSTVASSAAVSSRSAALVGAQHELRAGRAASRREPSPRSATALTPSTWASSEGLESVGLAGVGDARRRHGVWTPYRRPRERPIPPVQPPSELGDSAASSTEIERAPIRRGWALFRSRRLPEAAGVRSGLFRRHLARRYTS